MPSKRGPISYTPCRTNRGKFTAMSKCGAKRKTRKGKKGGRKSRKTSKKATGTFYRDKGHFCRKHGKRGFAKESSCKRAGV